MVVRDEDSTVNDELVQRLVKQQDNKAAESVPVEEPQKEPESEHANEQEA